MAIGYEKPNASLLAELEEVARHAGVLRHVVRSANALPSSFPVDEIERITGTLENLPAGTAEGCGVPLDYGRLRLAEIGQQQIRIAAGDAEQESDDAPPLARGEPIDLAFGQLLSAITYAQSEYARQAGERIAEQEPRRIQVEGSDCEDLDELAVEASKLEGEFEDFERKLDEAMVPGSHRMDQLRRQNGDAANHARLARNEIGQHEIVPSRLQRLIEVLKRLPTLIEQTARTLQRGVDIAEPFVEQWLIEVPADIVQLTMKHLRIFVANLENAGRKLQEPGSRKSGPSLHSSGDVFRDIDEPWCPGMVVIPAGSFLMGSPREEEGRTNREGPVRRVAIAVPFALGRFPVTFDEYDEFCRVSDREAPQDRDWGRGRRPVINVDVDEIEAYIGWLCEITRSRYRLPSESEWEYACRAGTTTPFWTGDTISTDQANYDGSLDYGSAGKELYRQRSTLVDNFSANAFGIFDMVGNVWERCADPWHETYEGAPTDGSVWNLDRDTFRTVVRGGAWNANPSAFRSAYRYGDQRSYRNYSGGFRVAIGLFQSQASLG